MSEDIEPFFDDDEEPQEKTTLSPGEYVIPKASTEALESLKEKLIAMNETDTSQNFAKGGYINATNIDPGVVSNAKIAAGGTWASSGSYPNPSINVPAQQFYTTNVGSPSLIAPMKVHSESELRIHALELALSMGGAPSEWVPRAEAFFDFLNTDSKADTDAETWD